MVHDLALSAAAQLNAGMNSARIALPMTVFMPPSPLECIRQAVQGYLQDRQQQDRIPR
jgi:hypothetical protein